MKRKDLALAADPTSYADGLATTNPAPHDAHTGHVMVRTDTYDGHAIEIRTMYEVTVDGIPVTAHMHIDNDGNVICHAIPVYRSSSMVDVVRKLIDSFPADFPRPKTPGRKPTTPGHHHGGGE
jgi:hypothetical protein